MAIFRTFGIEEYEFLDEIRRFHPIIRPEESNSLEESLDKLVKYLLRGRGSAGEIKIQTRRVGGETVVFAVFDEEGVINFNSIFADTVVKFMKDNYPLLPHTVEDIRTESGWTQKFD